MNCLRPQEIQQPIISQHKQRLEKGPKNRNRFQNFSCLSFPTSRLRFILWPIREEADPLVGNHQTWIQLNYVNYGFNSWKNLYMISKKSNTSMPRSQVTESINYTVPEVCKLSHHLLSSLFQTKIPFILIFFFFFWSGSFYTIFTVNSFYMYRVHVTPLKMIYWNPASKNRKQ